MCGQYSSADSVDDRLSTDAHSNIPLSSDQHVASELIGLYYTFTPSYTFGTLNSTTVTRFET